MTAAWAALGVIFTLVFNLFSPLFGGPTLELNTAMQVAMRIDLVLVGLLFLVYLILVAASAILAGAVSMSRKARRYR